MKTKNFFALSALCLLWLGSETATNGMLSFTEKAAAKWKTQHVDLGKILQNVPATVNFELINPGKTPLIISKVEAGCSCTVSSYPKDPIMPGKTGIVKATYNAAALGAFTKSVNVTANTEPEITILTFRGEVVKQ
jgi:hypothetical protein